MAASDVEELRQVIEQAFATDRQGVRAIGSNLQNGTVLVGVASDRIPTMAEVVADLLPGSQAISRTEDGSALVCSSDADPTEPCVIVKAVGPYNPDTPLINQLTVTIKPQRQGLRRWKKR